jgi:hypothetical protein
MNSIAADDVAAMFSEGKVSGQLREFTISREYDDSRPNAGNVGRDYMRKANAVGGYLKYETGVYNGVSLGAAVYTSIGFGLRTPRDDYYQVDPTLLGDKNENLFYLGEGYIQYKNTNTTFKGGRQKLDTPLAGSDDARMLPNLFEAYVLSNTDIKDTTLIAAHVTKIAQGTFGRVYDASASAGNAVLSVTSGYSLVDSRTRAGEFVDMGEYAIGENTAGVSVAAALYSGIPGLKLQLWDYYAHDILNAVYAEANYGISFSNGIAGYIAAQWINEQDVGSNTKITKVNSDFVAGKVGVKVANFDLYGAISHNSKDSSSAINGGTISPWGGSPAYTQGMVTRHQFMAGTDALKVAGSYDWKTFGVNLNTGVFYTQYDMDSLNGYSANYAWTASESGFDVIYSPQAMKNLQLRLRANFADDFYQASSGSVSWDEYRFIANYNF